MIVVSIVDLTTGACIIGFEALYGYSVISDGPLDDVYLGVLADTREVGLPLSGRAHPHGRCHTGAARSSHLHALRCWNSAVHIQRLSFKFKL